MESGEWIEVVAGIEEGDLVVTSAQFLLDSEASLAGSIQRLDTASLAPDSSSLLSAFGSGWIDRVNQHDRKITVSHGPIDELGWPGMTMEFLVSQQVDMTSFSPGQDIQFALRQTPDGSFVIENASPRQSKVNISVEQANSVEPPGVPAKAVEKRRFSGRAVVVAVDQSEHKLTLDHEPIEKLKWPAMTMSFKVLPSVNLVQVKAGQQIHFSIEEQVENSFAIVQIHIVKAESASEAQNHD